MTHDELANDLAGHLRTDFRMTWCNLQLGPRHSARPDVFTLDKSFVQPRPTVYEVKVSVSDFRADITAGKWQRYLAFSEAVYFACESGLISKSDVPNGCGLIVRGENGWRTYRKPTRQCVTLDSDVWLKLLIDGVEREGPRYRARGWDLTICGFAKRFGCEAARFVRDAAETHSKIKRAEAEAALILNSAKAQAEAHLKKAREQAPEKWRHLLEVLNLPSDADIWRVRRAINDLGDTAIRSNVSRIVGELRRWTDSLEKAVAPAQEVRG